MSKLKYEDKFLVINRKRFENCSKSTLRKLDDVLQDMADECPSANRYYVCNQDEPYAQQVIDLILGKNLSEDQQIKGVIDDIDVYLDECYGENKDVHVGVISAKVDKLRNVLSKLLPIEDQILMPKELTAENGAKAEFIGEYKTSETHTCIECGGAGLIDPDDEDKDPCEVCNGSGELTFTQVIDWTTTKQMYKDFVKFFNPAPPSIKTEGEGDKSNL